MKLGTIRFERLRAVDIRGNRETFSTAVPKLFRTATHFIVYRRIFLCLITKWGSGVTLPNKKLLY